MEKTVLLNSDYTATIFFKKVLKDDPDRNIKLAQELGSAKVMMAWEAHAIDYPDIGGLDPVDLRILLKKIDEVQAERFEEHLSPDQIESYLIPF